MGEESMRKRMFGILGLGVALILVASGCATSGAVGGTDVAAAAAAAPPAISDYKDEMGENGLPTVRALLARFVEAIGGENAIEAHTSFTAKGKFSLAAMGVNGDVTIHAAAPNRMRMVIETPMGNIASGFNGEVAWSDDPFSGARVLEGTARAAAAAQANFFGPLAYGDFYDSMETLEETEYAGQASYKVMLIDSEGGETTQYFAKESAFLIGQESIQDGPTGAAEVKVILSDYKDFGSGVLTAASTKLDAGGMEIENTIESVTFDDVDDSAFELPDSVSSQL